MLTAEIERAARHLVEHRLARRPLDRLPPACAPGDADDAYRIQHAAHRELEAAGYGPVGGRKIGCTTPVMQDYLKIPHPCAGGVLLTATHRGHGRYRAAEHLRAGVECEIAVRLGADLRKRPGGHDIASVTPAVSAVTAAIELVDDRYRDWSALDAHTLTADDFFNAGAVLGPDRRDWNALELTRLVGEMWINGASVGSGTGDQVLGHPLNALAWLADRAAADGRPLRAGEFVLLGSVVKTHWLAAGDRVRVRLEGLGEATLELL